MRKFVLAALAVAFSVSVCEARWARQRHCYVPAYLVPVQTEAVGSAPTDPQGTAQTAQGQPAQQYQSFQHDSSSSSVSAPRRVTSPNAHSQFQADRKIRGQ